MKKTVNSWIELADYDLETAEAMFISARYLYVAFTCQQTIEKMLKALIAYNTNDTPPYIHNLLKLISVAGLDEEITTDDLSFIDSLNSYYLEGRYAEHLNAKAKIFNKELAIIFLNNTKKLKKWIQDRIKF
jgi:HEPN domain-containing protein